MGMLRSRRLRYCLFLTVVSLLPFLYVEVAHPVRYIFRHSNTSSSCVIPVLDPYDPSIMKYMWDPQPLVCDSTPRVIYADESGVLQFNASALHILKIKQSDLRCYHKILRRNSDDVTIKFDNPVSFTPPYAMKADFFHVLCKTSSGTTVMDMLLTNVAEDNVNRTKSIEKESEKHLSVILFGIDSTSRSTAIRKLPNMVRYLTKELRSYDFKGYMKVGENTLPNLMPVLTGRRSWSDELPHNDYANKPYDSFPLIWKNFSDKGYATFYAEDCPEFNTFNYFTRGFVEQPTHHYLRPFWLGLDATHSVKSRLKYVYHFLENRNVNLNKVSSLCYKDIPIHLLQINYLKQFIKAYRRKRRFAFNFLVGLSHEYQNFLAYGDQHFLDFLKWLKNDGHLENTVLIVFSDHGSRIEQLRNTAVGRLEDRMPMLHIVLPEWLKTKYPNMHNAMQENTNRLTTAFDVHQTISDVLTQSIDKPSKFFIKNKARGISLFQPVPSDRSCADAWVPESYCPCYTSVVVNVSNAPVIDSIAAVMVQDINKLFNHLPECMELTLHKVRDARQIQQAMEYMHSEQTGLTGISVFQFFQPEKDQKNRYEISIETVPGYGIFEASYLVFGRKSIALLGDIVRTNRYGNQSDCMTDKRLKPFCYCRHHVE